MGDWELGGWEVGGGRWEVGDWRLGGSVAGKYCSGGGFGLVWVGLVWFEGFSKERKRRVQKGCV